MRGVESGGTWTRNLLGAEGGGLMEFLQRFGCTGWSKSGETGRKGHAGSWTRVHLEAWTLDLFREMGRDVGEGCSIKGQLQPLHCFRVCHGVCERPHRTVL
jgi:hypothetical protein